MARTMRLRAGFALGASALALAGCIDTGALDWDLRRGAGATSEAARQATAAAPTPDGNGIISYPDYQLATARRGETVNAVVVVRDAANPPAVEDIQAWCRERMASYKVPRIIRICDTFPREHSGKVKKHKLRQTLFGEIAA